MAQYRQSGADRFSTRGSHDHLHPVTNGATSTANSSDQIAIRIPHQKQGKIRRSGRLEKNWKISIVAVLLILLFILSVTFFIYNYLSDSKEDDRFGQQGDDRMNDVDFLSNVTRTEGHKVLKFGQGSVTMGRDSRYWDRDDRRRDSEYDEDASEHNNIADTDPSANKDRIVSNRNGRKQLPLIGAKSNVKDGRDQRSTGLYNEAGRDELKLYEAEFEASLKNIRQLGEENGGKSQEEEVDLEDEYDDGIDSQDDWMEEHNDTKNDNVDFDGEMEDIDDDSEESSDALDGRSAHSSSLNKTENTDETLTNSFEIDTSLLSRGSDSAETETRRRSAVEDESRKRSRSRKKSRRRGRHRRVSGSSCGIKFLDSIAQIVEPIENKKFSRFSLQYTEVEDRPDGSENWEPRFAGHQSLQEREESFYAHDKKINCGFIKGPKGTPSTGFDLAEDDVRFMSSCHIAVSSCIFGNSDNLRTPTDKVVTRLSRKNVCFVMFMDEKTLQTLKLEGQERDQMGFIGLWKIVVIKNLPYTDMRRVGKIPKFLTHRLFPSARYSIWLDSKLRLQSDPHLILEYFLWRKGYEYAISNHYHRHCVWEEVMQNKRLNKYNHTVIDQQFTFYQTDGLKRFNASDPNRLLPSYVPEGSFIMRAHTPMSNLFSCLWFNEVERFTPRDQLSFAYTYMKLRRMNPGKPFHLNMFKDCERRSIAKLYRHRTEVKWNPIQATG
ncbi:uncharacterized protein LOC131237428 [Magnolia sinica]|uniref:uncharacterized protein LOC131237428 n=1 Tax=Magnolia sinica TaxID=86752 RepID=UPI0026591D5E|nr:uncharacterized protein LOC131237428 [Magnolia sinica]